ncbi:MAG: hypothetical protein KIS77_14185 [Saprospiraceae bacterium]|nr:hypothetical protein [Saprospiraceae bacterium]
MPPKDKFGSDLIAQPRGVFFLFEYRPKKRLSGQLFKTEQRCSNSYFTAGCANSQKAGFQQKENMARR